MLDPPSAATYAASFEYTPAGRLAAAYIGSEHEGVDVFPRDVLYDYKTLPTEPATDPAAVRRLVSRTDGSDVATFDYDPRGNLIHRTTGDEEVRFVYDGDDRLREAIASSGNGREVYYYDHNGERMLAARIAGKGWLERIRCWFGESEIWYHPTGEVEKTLVHVALGGIPVARIENGNVADPELSYSGVLGHMLASITAQGKVNARFGYGPYGEILYAEGAEADEHRVRFNGKELDELTQLGYYGFRYYDRLSLSWTQADPFYRFAPDLAYAEPRRMNLYTFVLNNPLRYVDPDGLEDDGPRDDSDSNNVDLGPFETWRDKVIDTKVDLDPGTAPPGKEYAGLSVYIEWDPDDPESRQWYALWQPQNAAENGVPDSELNAVQLFIRKNHPWATVNPDTLKALDGLGIVATAFAPAAALLKKAGKKLVQKVLGKIFGRPSAAGAVGKPPNRIYSTRELTRRANEPGPFHNFPRSFDKEIFERGATSKIKNFYKKAKPGYSNDSMQYALRGSVNGQTGTFEIAVRPSTSGRTELIMHRFFRPDKTK